jgi:drug/metabolite transporter (DMT)-like permease
MTNGYGAVPSHDDVLPLTLALITPNISQLEAGANGDRTEEQSYLKSPYWWAGIMLMTVGETGNFLAYGFAPASIVSPLGVVALISNCIIAPIMLKEKFRMRDFWGVLVAVGGAVTIVLSAKQKEKKLGPHEVIGAITTLAFEIYMLVTVILIGILVWASPRYGRKTILIDLGLVGLFGGYTALSTKGVASMLSSSFWKAFTTPITYVLVAVLVGTAIMQVKYVNKALQRFDSTQVIPVQFVMFTLSVIIGSAVLYRDFEHTTPEQARKFVGGCLLTFFGVFLITSGRASRDEGEYEGSENGDSRIVLADQEESGDHIYQDRTDKHNNHHADLHAPMSAELLIEDDDESQDEYSRRSSDASHMPPRSSHPSQPPSIRFVPSTSVSGSPVESSPLLSRDADTLRTTSAPQDFQNSTFEAIRPSPSRRQSQLDTTSSENGHQEYHAPPSTADAASLRPVTPGRLSISKSIVPGPYMSPLSFSLSAVVADTLRRGTDIYGRSQRHPRLSLRLTRSGDRQGDEDLSGSPLKNGQSVSDWFSRSLATEESGRSTWGGNGRRSGRERAMSLGNKIGDFFGVTRRESVSTTEPVDEPPSCPNERA